MPEPGTLGAAGLQGLGWIIAAALAPLVLPLVWGLVFPRRLGGEAASAEPREWPEVTLVLPARDEEAAIGDALRSLLQLDYPRLHIVAIDDRSRDGTGRIMDQVSAGDPRVRVLHLDQLP